MNKTEVVLCARGEGQGLSSSLEVMMNAINICSVGAIDNCFLFVQKTAELPSLFTVYSLVSFLYVSPLRLCAQKLLRAKLTVTFSYRK